MLSLYHDFPNDPAVRREMQQNESEFHFIIAEGSQMHTVNNPFADDKLEVTMSLAPGVGLRLLPEGELTSGRIHVCYPQLLHTSQGKTHWDPREIADLKPFTLYRARGSFQFNEIRKEPYATIREVLEPLPDPEMEQLAAQAALPVILKTSIGELVLNRRFGTFDGRANELGVDVSVCYEGPEVLIAEQGDLKKRFKSALKFIDTVLSPKYLDDAQKLGAQKVLPTANKWRHDVAEAEGRPTPAPVMSAEDVYAKLTPTSVEIPHRGNIRVEFDDGYMFGGHPITVKTKRDGTPTSVEKDV